MMHLKKNKRIKSFLLIPLAFLWLGGLSSYAQSSVASSISGKVFFESYTGAIIGISYADIALVSGRDTIRTSTVPGGNFMLRDLRPGPAAIRVSHVSYQSFETSLELEEGENVFYVKLDLIPLEGASVSADVPPVIYKKDTVIYNGAAVKTMEGDNAIEILRQMPGVELRGSKIYVDGQEVKRTYVNGRLIYGNGVMTPLTAILADDVVNIKSYEQETVPSKQQGLKNSHKERVLDVTTRNPVFSAFDGYAVASAGLDQQRNMDGRLQGRYIVGLNANFFSEMLLAYINGYANNVGWDSNSFSSYNAMPGSLDGYKERISVQTGFEKYWGDRLAPTMIGASYAYSRGMDKADNMSRWDYYGTDARVLADTLSSASSRESHTFRLEGAVNNASIGTLTTHHTLVLERHSTESRMQSSLLVPGLSRQYQDRDQEDRTSGRSYTGSIFWTKNTALGISPAVTFDASLGQQELSGILVDTLASTFTQKHLETNGSDKDYKLSAGVSALMPLLNKPSATITLIPGYLVSREFTGKYQMALDVLDETHPSIDPINSHDYHWDVFSHGPALGASFSGSGISLTINARLLFQHLKDQEAYPATVNETHFFPVSKIDISFIAKRLSCGFHSDGSIPSAEQLRDRIDDRNPFYLRQGNPSLRPSQTHRLTVDGKLLEKGTRSLSFYGNFQIQANPIVWNKTYFSSDTHIDGSGGYDVKAGSTLISYVNAPASISLFPQLKYAERIQRSKLNLSFALGCNYNLRPQYIDDELVTLNEWIPSYAGEMIWSPSRRARMSLRHGLQYVHGENSLGQTMPRIVHHSVGLSAQVQFFKFFMARAQYALMADDYLDDTYTDRFTNRLDALVSITLMKGRLGISISGNDLLNQGQLFSITTDANYQHIAWTPSYGRYFMFNIVYRLNKTSPSTSFRGMLKKG